MVLFLIAVSIIVITVLYNLGKLKRGEEYEAKFDMIVITVATVVVYALFAGAIYLESFASYASSRAQYDAMAAQYGLAVTIYSDKAVLDVRKVGESLTDLKYQGYQENISKLVVDLRNMVSSYNYRVVSKKAWAKNPIFGWYIVLPDPDMKLIDMMDQITE